MKTPITFDFLRGLLVACVARDAERFLFYFLPINFSWSSVPSGSKWVLMLAAVLTIAVYTVILTAVLCRPTSTTKVVFGLLLVIAVVWMGFLRPTRFRGPANGYHRSFIRSVVPWSGSPLTAVIALICVLKLKRDKVIVTPVEVCR